VPFKRYFSYKISRFYADKQSHDTFEVMLHILINLLKESLIFSFSSEKLVFMVFQRYSQVTYLIVHML